MPQTASPAAKGLTLRQLGMENRNVIANLLPMSHKSASPSQNRHEPGLLRPFGRAISTE
jgi:hypothetical protein